MIHNHFLTSSESPDKAVDSDKGLKFHVGNFKN